MAGTDPIAEADADALFVLTAALLTPARFPSVLGDDYPAACAALGLRPYAEGYGLVFGQDGRGARWTVVVDDVSLVAVAISSWDCGMAYDLSPDERSVVAGLPGWPLPVATVAPGVPAPHDPEPEEGDPAPLISPSGEEWGPAQRRLGADEVALQWDAWRARVGDEAESGTARTSEATGATGATGADSPRAPASARPDDQVQAPLQSPAAAQAPADAAPAPATGVGKALAELRGYLEEPPPVGRVRSASGTLRVDGPGWSLVAKADDMAFVLLDELPHEVLPVTRGPRLPALLEALDAMAIRPS